jgi:hypothetical protein
MGDKNFIIWLSDIDYILVIIKSRNGKIISYVIKYITKIRNKVYEVAKFDSGHNYSHMDILRPDGTKERVVRFSNMDKENAINFAIENFKLNFDIYYERFLKWLKD